MHVVWLPVCWTLAGPPFIGPLLCTVLFPVCLLMQCLSDCLKERSGGGAGVVRLQWKTSFMYILISPPGLANILSLFRFKLRICLDS